MEDNTNHDDVIRDYWRGNMSAEEKAAFERRFANDLSLAKEVFLMKEEFEALEHFDEKNLRSQMASWGNEKRKKNRFRSFFWPLALIVALASLYFLAPWQSDAPTPAPSQDAGPEMPAQDVPPEKIEETINPPTQTIDPLPEKGKNKKSTRPTEKTPPKKQAQPKYIALIDQYKGIEFRSALKGGSGEFNNAMRLMSDGEYKKGAAILEGFKEGSENFGDAQYYLGFAYIEMKEYGKAIAAFQNILGLDEYLYKETAKWHLALAYIGTGQVENAKSILNEFITSGNSRFKSTASELSQKLR